MNNISKILISIAALIASLSLLYFFVVRPIQADKEDERFYQECLTEAESIKQIRTEAYDKTQEAGRDVSHNNPIIISGEYDKMKGECFKEFRK